MSAARIVDALAHATPIAFWLDSPDVPEPAPRLTGEHGCGLAVVGAGYTDRTALVDPARLAWGLRAACDRAGVRIAEGTQVTGLARDGAGVRLTSAGGSVQACQVALCTNAFRPLLRRVRPYVVPVYDYVLMSERLSAEQLASVGWRGLWLRTLDRLGMGFDS